MKKGYLLPLTSLTAWFFTSPVYAHPDDGFSSIFAHTIEHSLLQSSPMLLPISLLVMLVVAILIIGSGQQ